MPRIKVYYTDDSSHNSHVYSPRWLCPVSGMLYMSEVTGVKAIASKFTEVSPGRWETTTGTAVRQDVHVEPKAPVIQSDRGAGLKADGGKGRWTLLMQGFPLALAGVVEVLGFGAKKYAAHSWRQVENAPERYRDALYRHLNALEGGELVDPESGLSHWEHICFNALALNELSKAVPNG